MVDNTIEDAQTRVNPCCNSKEEYQELEKELAVAMYRKLGVIERAVHEPLLRVLLKISVACSPLEAAMMSNLLAEHFVSVWDKDENEKAGH